MIEAAVEMDDDALGAYLDGKEPDIATLKICIRKATVTRAFFPILCGSAFKNKGVQPLLDAVVDYLPSPFDVPPTRASTSRPASRPSASRLDDEPLSMLAFKIMDDPYVGSSPSAASTRARFRSGTALLNTTRGKNERIGRMFLMHANQREEIKEAYAGDIVALVGLKDTRTGDTLCDPPKPVMLEKMDFPDPVIEMAIEPKTKADQEKMGARAACMAAGGSLLPGRHRPGIGPDHHQGHGRAASRHQGRHPEAHARVEANVGAPQVAYRETITRPTEIDYTHKKQTGGTGQFARVKLRLEPNEAGKGFEFEKRDRRRHRAEGIHSGRREGRAERVATPACSSAFRWST